MKKLTSLQFSSLESYIFNCIAFENYGINPETNEDKINTLIETFKSEFWHDYNQKYYKYDIKVGFANWLMGLPSCFNVDFENYRILEIGKEWNFDLSTEVKEDRFLENWFKMVTNSVFYLYNKKSFKQVRASQKEVLTSK